MTGKSIYLSTLRSGLFNEVLAARVRAGSWRRQLPGDVLTDGVPTGPLWGRGKTASTLDAGALEQAALAPYAAIMDALEFTGVNQARRPLAVRPAAAEATLPVDADPVVAFELPPGAYATVLLGELGRIYDASAAGREDR